MQYNKKDNLKKGKILLKKKRKSKRKFEDINAKKLNSKEEN